MIGTHHKCPAAGCDKSVPNDLAFCRRHWFMVPQHLRHAIWKSYRAGHAGTEEHINLIDRAADAIVSERVHHGD